MLKSAKNYDGNDKKVTGPNTRLESGGSKVVIGRDGNSRNYAVECDAIRIGLAHNF